MFADVLDLPIKMTQGDEVNARGTAMCTAVALGLVPDFPTAMQQMVRVERTYLPDQTRHEAYARKYKRFARATRALAATWGELAEDTTS